MYNPPPQLSQEPEIAISNDASLGKRLLAQIVNGFLFWVIFFSVFYFTGDNPSPTIAQKYGHILLFSWLVYFICQAVLLSLYGQSIGKKLLGIKIVQNSTLQNGGFINNVLLRVGLNSLLIAIPFYALIDILCIFRQDHRCLHDLIAGTVVVEA